MITTHIMCRYKGTKKNCIKRLIIPDAEVFKIEGGAVIIGGIHILVIMRNAALVTVYMRKYKKDSHRTVGLYTPHYNLACLIIL